MKIALEYVFRMPDFENKSLLQSLLIPVFESPPSRFFLVGFNKRRYRCMTKCFIFMQILNFYFRWMLLLSQRGHCVDFIKIQLSLIDEVPLILVLRSEGFVGFYYLDKCCYKCTTVLIESLDVILKHEKERIMTTLKKSRC